MMTDDEAAIIKGMLARGDKQQWIVAWFGGVLNPGRVADIATGKKFKHVNAAPVKHLPPVGPYISGRSANRALIALQPVKAAIDRAIKALSTESNDE